MPISEIAAGLSGLAVVAGALSSFLALRIQRDMARLKNEILEGINGKYISRKEHDIIDRQRDSWQVVIDGRIEETRRHHHDLHEEFIACRAASKAGPEGKSS